MINRKNTQDSESKIISGTNQSGSRMVTSTSYQTKEFSSYSSQTSSQRVFTRTLSTSTHGDLPSTSSATTRNGYQSPNQNRISSLISSFDRNVSLDPPRSAVSNKPRSIFDIDARPFTSGASDSPHPGSSSWLSESIQRPTTMYSSQRTATPSNPAITSSNLSIPNELTKSRDPRIPTYDTNGKKRGKVLIINNVKFMKKDEERKGAEVDGKRISELFRKMGFEVKLYRDLKKLEMLNKIDKFRLDKSLGKVDISVVILMSHGHNRKNETIIPGSFTQIVGIDGESLPTEDVLSKFDSINCSSLKGKPKIFIFQCCRGEQKELQVDAAPIRNVIKQHADVLIAFSTLPGFFSLRDPVKGSWYIQSICDIFERHAKEFDVETLLKIVDDQLSKKHPEYQQTSSYESRGFKRCYLNPVDFR
ncbi:hypothetical protein JTB14_033283 [Gonioctena quinquepunctata]|nr:hypothetical protein JTB14_033283 [Gonioctena quinquepunctata]